MNPSKTENLIVLRKMAQADLVALEALDRYCFEDPWPEGSFAAELQKGEESLCLVAEAQDQSGSSLAGLAVFWLIADEAHLGTIAVHPDRQRQGIAKALLLAGLNLAYAKGARSSLLELRAGNLAALQLYTSLGYEIVGWRKGYYSAGREDALLMTLPKIEPEGRHIFTPSRPISLNEPGFRVESSSGAANVS